MNLKQIKALVVELTGRHDLTSNTTTANFFVNAAIRFLDGYVTHRKSLARHVVRIPAGSFYVYVGDCSAIHEVWFATSEGRTRLDKRPLSELREDYASMFASLDSDLNPSQQVLATAGTGTPAYYSPLIIAPSERQLRSVLQQTNEYGFRYDLDGLLLGDHYNYSGVLFLPATESDASLSVVGRFTSGELSDEADYNYWSFAHPEVLAKAVAYQMETFYSNTQGVKDWMTSLEFDFRRLESDLVEEEAAEVRRMQG